MTGQPTRRAVLAGGMAAAVTAHSTFPARARSGTLSLRIDDLHPGPAISPLVFGCNEIGAMDGGPLSSVLDRKARVTVRRLGGNLMSGYNWVNNATNAGKDYRHSNGAFLLEALQIPRSEWTRPAVVIEAMHEASLAMGAQSLVTLPLGAFVAGDFSGAVTEDDSAPSRRFTPVRWESRTRTGDPIDPRVADVPHMLRRLMAQYGSAASRRGISGYILDNEPGLWAQNHPRLFPRKTTIRAFIARSIAVARIIKSIDPEALILGPGSWGATGMVTLQGAPDWSRYRNYGSFLSAYLDAFARASATDGKRLLDVLDVHWYPFSSQGNLFRTEDPALDGARLDAPRTLLEPGFTENSWVARALRGGGRGAITLPIIPGLQKIIADRFPGTRLAITEFNYGGSKSIASGLALADALGSYSKGGVFIATHWGSLPDWLGEAYRLYRTPDGAGHSFGGRTLTVQSAAYPTVSAYASVQDSVRQLVLLNKDTKPHTLNVAFASGRAGQLASLQAMDGAHKLMRHLDRAARSVETRKANTGWQVSLPPRSARRLAFL